MFFDIRAYIKEKKDRIVSVGRLLRTRTILIMSFEAGCVRTNAFLGCIVYELTF